jgi:RNA polymerase sigma-70 factor (ECF subfamily)
MRGASTNLAVLERELLEPARDGEEDAFRRLVELHRAELHAHCYRMLGSVHDAEDALQNTLLRAWRGLSAFEGRSSLRSWLYRIATNVCLDAISRRPKRVLPIDYGPPGKPDGDPGEPLAHSVWIEPYPDDVIGIEDGRAGPDARYEQREAVELAFIAALQNLPPRQRAVLILREVLGFSAREVAEALDSSVASVNSALQRARRTIDDRLPERSQQATLRALGDNEIRDLVERFIHAFEHGEVDAILDMLADDATFSMPPYAEWARGRDAIADSWLMPSGPPPRLRYVRTRANAQLAVAAYLRDRADGTYRPLALDVLSLRGAEIADVVAFRGEEAFRAFGLPRTLGA